MSHHPSHDGAHIHPGRLTTCFVDEYLKLVRDPQLWQRNLDEALRKIVAALTKTLATQQSSIWCFSDARDAITQRVHFDSALDRFEHGLEL